MLDDDGLLGLAGDSDDGLLGEDNAEGELGLAGETGPGLRLAGELTRGLTLTRGDGLRLAGDTGLLGPGLTGDRGLSGERTGDGLDTPEDTDGDGKGRAGTQQSRLMA